jgi:hypothetical protein
MMRKSKSKNRKNQDGGQSPEIMEAVEAVMKKRTRKKRPFLAVFIVTILAVLGFGGGAYYLNTVSEKIAAKLDKGTKRALRRSGAKAFVSYDEITVQPLARSVTYHDISIKNDEASKIVEIDAITISNFRKKDDIVLSAQLDIKGASSPYSEPFLSEDIGMLSLYAQSTEYAPGDTYLPVSALNYQKLIGDVTARYAYDEKEETLTLALHVVSRDMNEASVEIVFAQVDIDLLANIAEIIDNMSKAGGQEFLQLLAGLENGDISSFEDMGQTLQIINDVADIELASFALESHDLGLYERLTYILAYPLGQYDSQQVDLVSLLKRSGQLEEFQDEINSLVPGLGEVALNSMKAGGRVSIRTDFSSPLPLIEKRRGEYDLSSELYEIIEEGDMNKLIEDGDILISN